MACTRKKMQWWFRTRFGSLNWSFSFYTFTALRLTPSSIFILFKCQFYGIICYTVDIIKTLWVWLVGVMNEHRTADRLNWNDRMIAIWVCVVDLVFNHPWKVVNQKGVISSPSVHVKVIHLNSSPLKYCWLVYVLFDTCVFFFIFLLHFRGTHC